MIENGHVDRFLKDAKEQSQVHLRVPFFPQKDSISFLCSYLAFSYYYFQFGDQLQQQISQEYRQSQT